jgi:hypothetical protein
LTVSVKAEERAARKMATAVKVVTIEASFLEARKQLGNCRKRV